jgi:hypothetical protein
LRAQGKRELKFIPQSNLTILDPIWTTAYATRNYGHMVFDTLYGQSGEQNGFKATPQMVAGHVIGDDGKTWKFTLRSIYCSRMGRWYWRAIASPLSGTGVCATPSGRH